MEEIDLVSLLPAITEALMRRIMRRNLNGARGLIAAVIAQAVNDWRSGTRKRRKNARRYFGGPVYKYHLSLLDLPRDWLPRGVKIDGG